MAFYLTIVVEDISDHLLVLGEPTLQIEGVCVVKLELLLLRHILLHCGRRGSLKYKVNRSIHILIN